MINIYAEEPYSEFVDVSILAKAIQTCFDLSGVDEELDINLVIDSDEAIHELNKEYRGVDSPTDVLSFESGEIDPETGREQLGDIMISYPRAVEQANKSGHPIIAEIQLLTIHGTLHLLGHDHADDEEKAKMWAMQRSVLDAVGCILAVYPE